MQMNKNGVLRVRIIKKEGERGEEDHYIAGVSEGKGHGGEGGGKV